MRFTEHILYEINSYILLKNEGNEFLSLVEDFFKEHKLTFSLLEMVLLKETGIGETYIFTKKGVDSKTLYQNYINLINEFKEEFKGGVASYKDWYNQNTWIYRGTGHPSEGIYNISQYTWEYLCETKDIKEYGEKVGISKSFIQTYLDTYAEAFTKLELNKHPHFCIIIQPVYKIDPHTSDVIPMGNLYLHFATLNEVSLNEAYEFLNKFMITWFKNYGGIGHSHLVENLLNVIIETSSEVKYYTPTELGTHTKALSFCYCVFFKESTNLDIFKIKIAELGKKLEQFSSDPESVKKQPNFFQDYRKKASWSDLIKSFSPEQFQLYLLKRCLVLILFYSFELPLKQIHSFVLAKTAKDALEPSSIRAYFYQNLHLYFSDLRSENDLRNEGPSGVSLFELQLIDQYKSAIVSLK